MADDKKPGEELTQIAEHARTTNIVKNIYQPTEAEGYSPSHPNAVADGDELGRGTKQFLDIYNEEAGTRTDIHGNGEANTGRINNLKTNTFDKKNPYSAGNLDSGPGYEATATANP